MEAVLKRIYLYIGIVALLTIIALYFFARSPTKFNLGDNRQTVEQFDSWRRHSQYIEMRDGVRLAVDIYRPTQNGRLHEAPLPVVWMHTPYHRQKLDENGNRQPDEVLPPLHEGADVLLKNGYVFAAVDARGYGASFGSAEIWIGPQQTEDAYDLIDWFATQSWSSGKVGMTGRSYLATAQYFAAASGHPALKAIFPEMGGFDNYNIFYTNGIYRHDLAIGWDQAMAVLNNSAPFTPNSVAPIDDDKSGELLKLAINDHKNNRSVLSTIVDAEHRDSELANSNLKPHIISSPSSLLTKIEEYNVAVYQRAGWFDLYSKDALLYHANLDNPQKLVIGPWYHREYFGFNRAAEKVQWFDYWLKGKNNGIMNEAAVDYYVVGDGWKNTSSWPPKTTNLDLHFAFDSSPRGHLAKMPANTNSSIRSQVNYDTTLGTTLERNNGLWPDRVRDCANVIVEKWCYSRSGYEAQNLDNVFQFTSETLQKDTSIVGSPTVELWMSSDEIDTDIFVILEEIDLDGNSQYISQGGVRASHRKLIPAPYKNFDLPWVGNLKEDVQLLDGTPTKLNFELYPVSNLFEKGHRIKILVSGADSGSHLPSLRAESSEIVLWQGPDYRTKISLPESSE